MGIAREIVVYSCQPHNKYRWISYVTIGQLSFIVVNLFVLPTPELVAKRQAKKISVSNDGGLNQSQNSLGLRQKLAELNYGEIFSTSNIVSNLTGRPYFSFGLIFASGLITMGLIMRARRSIHMMTLLPEDKVRISTFSPIAMGKPPTIEIPLSHLSCLQPRESGNKNYSMLKIKGRVGVHLLDKAEGVFHEPKLFDQYLGYARSWASR